jgi:hypothetical protein
LQDKLIVSEQRIAELNATIERLRGNVNDMARRKAELERHLAEFRLLQEYDRSKCGTDDLVGFSLLEEFLLRYERTCEHKPTVPHRIDVDVMARELKRLLREITLLRTRLSTAYRKMGMENE